MTGPIRHVVPVDDAIEHSTFGFDCPCDPTKEAVLRDDGTVGWVISHNALDGREDNPA